MENNNNIGYKFFEKVEGNVYICRDARYEVGKYYQPSGDGRTVEEIVDEELIGILEAVKPTLLSPSLICTKKAIHFFKKPFSPSNIRYNSVPGILAKIKYYDEHYHNQSKSCASVIKIESILSTEEYKALKEESEIDELDKSMHISVVKQLQTDNPTFIIGGSVALYLHGIRLKRFKDNASDLDIISPYYQIPNISSKCNVQTIDEKTSGNDFDETFLYYSNGSSVKIDYKVDPRQKYELIEYRGFKYKVVGLEDIWEAKIRYSKYDKKHYYDLREAMGLSKDQSNESRPF